MCECISNRSTRPAFQSTSDSSLVTMPETVIPIRHHRIEIPHVKTGRVKIDAKVLHAYPTRVRAEIVQIERVVHVGIQLFRPQGTSGGRVTGVESAGVCSAVMDVSALGPLNRGEERERSLRTYE